MSYTIKDVSNVAGVSIATVSHVINNTKYVTNSTRKKVLDSINILDYKPNITARNFKMGKRQTVGFIVPDISNVFWATLINEVEWEISKQNYMLMVINTQENSNKELEVLRRLTSGIVDGLIVASTFKDYSNIEKIISSNFPILFLDRKLENCACDTIVISNYRAVYKGVENLIKRGHQKIGCVTGYQSLSTLDERLQAYKDCLKDHGIEENENIILRVNIMSKNIVMGLEQFFSNDITAAIFLNNTLTTYAYFYATNNNFILKKDIEMVGYSEDAWHHYAERNIDIITQPIEDMGRISGKRILERINDPSLPINDIVLQANYLEKTSIKERVNDSN